jgi:hypothetical protein
VNIDRNVNVRTGDITVNRGNKVGKWQHNPTHRGNINYKNKKTKAKYSRDLKRGPVDRDVARGYKRDGKGSAGRDRQRPGSKQPGGAKRPASADRKQVAKRDGKQVQRRDANLKRPEKAKTRANAQQRPAAKPQGRDAKKPQTRPQTRDVKKPQTRPQSRDVKKPQTKPASRQARPQNKGSGAFKKSSARTDRAASNRGSRSVKRSGGGGGGRARARR